jgi:CheY-like chemotaxis protein
MRFWLANDEAARIFAAAPCKKFTDLGISYQAPGLRVAVEAVKTSSRTLAMMNLPWPVAGPELHLDVAITPAAEPIAAVRARYILVVEDNRDPREVLRAVLELQGHVLSDTGDGMAAVRLAIEQTPDLVLLDIGLPDVDAFETGRRIRRRLGERVRLVALSSYGDDDARRLGGGRLRRPPGQGGVAGGARPDDRLPLVLRPAGSAVAHVHDGDDPGHVTVRAS